MREGDAPGGESHIVLVVDDSPDTLRLLTDAIEATGATVLVALEGSQALAIAAEITPDIVLMDAVMPGIDGFETTRRLKADPALRHVPVVFMTGLNDTEHVVRGLEAGGVDYVVKPIVPDELLARIRVHLASARAAHSARAALDTTGRFLFATSGEGRVLWATPQAGRLLGTAPGAEGPALPAPVRDWLAAGADPARAPAGGWAQPPEAGRSVALSFVGKVAEGEHLFRLSVEDATAEEALLRERFQLTAREADVVVWLARGKSNRDIAEILSLSPRTVNKHLEVVFAKLGVENRASATFLVMRTLGER
ncbi:DNA-binding response regulator [Aureimonas flava]|uniref:DNA-binding response regulator n=1 Tax=Aureimonas flava TaxID=2320271 RepID=A0A3A1WWH8_9HYPH|nr:response regulator transcription factor [Aureimonas flava]RIY02738.1 DNA-binding response regulator [Aureimonas flava]